MTIACNNNVTESDSQIDKSACINGTIYKYNTGNSTNALVQLLKNNEIIESVAISSDGSYEIRNLAENDYMMRIWKLGYDKIDEEFGLAPVTVRLLSENRCVRYDYPISKIPPTLNVVEINNPEIVKYELNFSYTKTEDSFRVYNNTDKTITWYIDWESEKEDCQWLRSISITSDSIKPGEGSNVVVRIDPTKLSEKEEQTQLIINGTKESGGWVLTLKAVKD